MDTPVNPTPEDRMSNLYFTLLGEPRRHKDAVKTKWPAIFRTLLEEYTEAELTRAINWTFGESFWDGKLDRWDGDPVEYFAAPKGTLRKQWHASIRSTQRKTPASSGGPRNQPPVLDQYTKDHILTMFQPE
jgi:hypothetical protein